MNLRIRHLFLLSILYCSVIYCQNHKSENHFEQIGTLYLNYTTRGTGPVMLVGHPHSGKIGYELTLKPLERYFTIVYYEPRGTGKSEAPKTIKEYNPNYIVDEIEDLRKHLKVAKIWLFGHSDQSAIAFEYALKYPDNISGLIVTGTSFIGTQQESIERRKEFENKRAKESKWFAQVLTDWDYMESNKTTTDQYGNDLSTAPIKWWCYDEASSQKVISTVEEITKSGRRKAIENQYYYETLEERLKYLDIQKNFSDIKTNVLIVNGKFDTNNPPEFAEKLHQSLPTSELLMIEKAGHFPWVENPDKTFLLIEKWLDKILKQR